MARNQKPPSPAKVGFFQMLRDVLVASLNKGQFPLACVLAVVLTFLIRMPPSDVSTLAWRLLDGLENGKMLGYALFGATLLGWYAHARFLRKTASDEMRRVAEERNRLQEGAIGKKLRSSDKP